MIKNLTLLLFLSCTTFGFSQVGIGTTSPTPGYALDVNGSLLVQDEFKVNNFPDGTLQSNNYKFLVRLPNSVPPGEVAKLDLTQIPVAPVNIADYKFTNLQRDNVTNVDLQFDASKYIVGVANFRYEGQSIPKGANGAIGDFVYRVFVEGGTWHIEMRNRTLDAAANNTITYSVSLIIYDRKYFKTLAPISVNLNGSNTGAAAAPTEL